MEGKKRKKRKASRGYILIVPVVLILILVIGIYIMRYTKYEYVQFVKTYESETTNNGKYTAYADGVLEYSKDGIAVLTEKGEEIWNHPCQMKNPMAEVCEDIAVVADKGGTSIYVVQKSGLKGEIQTARPIERMSVSAQGIVAVILQDEETPRIMCYDSKGNILVEHKASFKNTGYPIDLALSRDGEVMMVSYLCTKGSGIATKVAFYHFGEEWKDKKDHQVMQEEYKDTIAPMAMFLDQKTSVLVTDNSLIFYEGLKEPEKVVSIEIEKEIESVAYDEKHIALMLKNSGETGYELRLYRLNGKQKMSVQLDGEYESIKISKGQVLLNDGNKCAIYNSQGICKFEGVMEMNIMDIYPIVGMNKYMVISANGFQEIQLAK